MSKAWTIYVENAKATFTTNVEPTYDAICVKFTTRVLTGTYYVPGTITIPWTSVSYIVETSTDG